MTLNYTSDVHSIGDLFNKGRGNFALIIPEYQREFKWTKEQYGRLISSILHNFSRLEKAERTSCFLGSIIFSESKSTEDPDIETSYDVVDGQQRLSSITILMISLYNTLQLELQKFTNNNSSFNPSEIEWVKNEFRRLEKYFIRFILYKIDDLDGTTFLPRIIRHQDTRSSNTINTEYNSTISKFVEKFRKHIKDIDEFVLEDDDTLENEIFKYFSDLFENFNHENPISDEGNDLKFVDYEILNRKGFLELFYDKNNKEHIKKIINKFKDQEGGNFIRLILISNYLFNCCAFSLIICKDSNDAFDIFDSLNTTGLPLTAIETLKPRIMLYYKNQNNNYNYKGSESEKAFNYIDDLFTEFYETTQEQQDESKKLTVAAKLYIDGEKTSENLSEQRLTISSLQQEAEQESKPDEVILTIKALANYRSYFYNKHNIRSSLTEKLINLSDSEISLVQLLSSLFKETNTHLVIPSLTRFYEDAVKRRDFKNYLEFLKAISAFFILRRSSTGTTDGIDKCFRNLMKQNTNLGFVGIQTNLNSSKELPDLNTIKIFFNSELRNSFLSSEEVLNREKWSNHVSKLQLYRYSRYLIRILLLLSHQNTKPDKDDHGLLTRENTTPSEERNFLNYATWNNPIYATVEHVAPNSTQEFGWEGVYDNSQTKNSLGNFVLLPSLQNIELGTYKWDIKKRFYHALSSSDEAQRKKLLSQAIDNGYSIKPARRNELISKATASRMLAGIYKVENWDKNFIEKRSKRLCELAWDELIKWIRPTE